jgi:hypothetical protein
MSQRTKFIALGVLVALLGFLAYRQFAGQAPARDVKAPPPVATITTSAPAGDVAAKPADPARASGPTAADLRELADWLDLLHPTGAVMARGTASVFGLTLKTAPPAPNPVAQEPGQIPWMTEPGKLDGIVRVGDGPRKALFQGELYQVGQRVRGTTFTLTAVEEDFVTLKSDDRVIRRFWHE